MTVDRKRLRELAQAAADDACEPIQTEYVWDHFHSAANPQTILDLLDALEAAEQSAAEAQPRDGLVEEIAADLDASAKRYRDGGHMRQYDLESRAASALRSLAAALQRDARDAARYRFIRQGRSRTYNTILIYAASELDKRVDAAIAEQAKE